VNWKKPGIIASDKPLYPWIILFNTTFISFVASIIAVGPNVEGLTIRGALHLSSDEMRWVSIGFIMMLGGVLPLGIWMAERFGYKVLFFIGTVIFTLGCVGSAFPWDFYSCLAGRVIMGLGGGIVFPLANSLIAKVFPKQTLPVALALYIGFGFGVGSGAGYFLGGYCAQYIGWQSLFLISAFLCVPSLFLTWLFHEESDPKPEEKFDYWGFLFFVVFVSCLLIVINSGKAEWNTEGWTSPFILTASMIGLIGLVLLLYYERTHPHPLILFSLLRSHSFLLGTLSVAFTGIMVYVTMTMAPVLTVELLRYEPYMGGLVLLPVGVMIGAGSVAVVLLSKRVGIRWLSIIGMSLLAIGCYLNADYTLYSSHGQFQWQFNVRAVGIAFALGPATALAMSAIPKSLAGAASILVVLGRQIGGTIGTAAAEAIMVQRAVFHDQIFGNSINPESPRFQEVSARVQDHLVQQTGAAPLDAAEQAMALLRQNVQTQSAITSFNDAFLLIGSIIAVITVLLFVELLWSTWKRASDAPALAKK